MDADIWQDREAEPRFIGSSGGRGGFGGGMQGGYAGYGGFGGGGPGRQIYIANVCLPPHSARDLGSLEQALIFFFSSFRTTSAGRT